MKGTAKRLLLALCVVLCVASAGWCVDPFKANHGGFGPKIKGFWLGMKITKEEAEDAQAKGVSLSWRKADNRIAKMVFSKSSFGAGQMTDGEFLQEFVNAYSIPSMKVESHKYSSGFERMVTTWSYRNTSEGWGVIFEDGWHEITVFPIVTESKFD